MHPRRHFVTLFFIVATVFIADLAAPLGLGIPFLYLLAPLVAIGTRQSNQILVVLSILCPVLAASKLLLPATGGVLEFGQGNRLIFSLLMWIRVGLELARRHFEMRIQAERLKFSRDLERLVRERTEALHEANAELQSEVTVRKEAERALQDYADRVQALADRLVEAQEIERLHLATELHDRIGQNLSALNINLTMNLAQLPADVAPAVPTRIRDSLALVEQTTEIVRGVMEELHPALLDQYGLDTALRWYGEEFSGRTGIRVEHQATDGFPRLKRKAEITLFRIAQEALTNVAKHARATVVTVSLARMPDGIELAISDNGVGLDPNAAGPLAAGSHWGLTIMAERARTISARFQIDSAPQKGTRIRVAISNGAWETEDADHRTNR
jgi:signal transduction histidine kinase